VPSEDNRTQRVLAALREDIVSWKLPPGETLAEARIAAEMSVSRTPVREALRTLQQDGLVKVVPGRGVFVAEIGLQDVVEIYQMREALEIYAARLSAANEERTSDFRALLTEFDAAQEWLDAGRLDEYYALSQRLDEHIALACGNRRLEQALRTLWDQARRLRRVASDSPKRVRETIGEHSAILHAIIEHDADAAEQAVRQHSHNSLQNLMAELWRSPGANLGVGRSRVTL
jgi:DNA-binding GntR family transcriptional regulator